VNRRVAINLGVFAAVFAVMLYWAVNNIITIDTIERPYEISGEFAQAAGVRSNSEVTYLGVHYGTVSSVERRIGGVRIHMKIERGKELPAGAIARIFRKSAIGEPYIDFVPPSGDNPPKGTIHKGDVIPVARTTVPLEFSELLRSAANLIGSIDPDKAGSLVHELALGLDGRGQDLRDLTTGFDRITATFAARTEALDRLAENSTRITKVLADHRLSIGQSITNLRAVAGSLRNSKGNLEELLRSGPAFLTQTADLVAEQKRNLDCLLTDLAPVLHLAGAEHTQDLAVLLEQGPIGFGYVFSAIDREPDGPWIRVNLQVPVGYPDPKLYIPRKTLPVVPTISPCSSTMTPAPVYPAATNGGTTATGTGAPTSPPKATSASQAAPFDARSAADVVRQGAAGEQHSAPAAAGLALLVLAGSAALVGTRLPDRYRRRR
jgi:phospholipid/cholesterol/gamma-HCH transport system substrate-binding protein